MIKTRVQGVLIASAIVLGIVSMVLAVVSVRAEAIEPPKSFYAAYDPYVNRIKLFWNASPTTDIDGYRIYRSTDSDTIGDFEQIAMPGKTATSFTDTVTTPNVYYYYIKAYNGEEKSAWAGEGMFQVIFPRVVFTPTPTKTPVATTISPTQTTVPTTILPTTAAPTPTATLPPVTVTTDPELLNTVDTLQRAMIIVGAAVLVLVILLVWLGGKIDSVAKANS